MKVSAVIPAKKESARVPHKNMIQFGDTTLLGHKIKQLQACDKIDEIIVGSDCKEILNYSQDLGALPVQRPDEVCDEAVCSANEMIGDMCDRISTGIVVWAHCTNPLISPETYDRAVDVFLGNQGSIWGSYDSLVSVDVVREHLWKDGEPLNYDPWAKSHTLAKDLPTLFKQNGAIFIQTHKQMSQNSYFFGKKPYLFVTPPNESIDINTPLDLGIARALCATQNPWSITTSSSF